MDDFLLFILNLLFYVLSLKFMLETITKLPSMIYNKMFFFEETSS